MHTHAPGLVGESLQALVGSLDELGVRGWVVDAHDEVCVVRDGTHDLRNRVWSGVATSSSQQFNLSVVCNSPWCNCSHPEINGQLVSEW